MNNKIIIKIILLANLIIQLSLSLQCDKYCQTCNHLGKCIECFPNTIFNSDLIICQFACQDYQFYSKIQDKCVYECDEEYFPDLYHKVCQKHVKVPNLYEKRDKILSQNIKGVLYDRNPITEEITLITYGNNLFLEFIYPQEKTKPNEISQAILQIEENKGKLNEVIHIQFTQNKDYIIGLTSQNYIIHWNYEDKTLKNTTHPQKDQSQDILYRKDQFFFKNQFFVYVSPYSQNKIYVYNYWTEIREQFVLDTSCENHIIKKIHYIESENMLYTFGEYYDSSQNKNVMVSKIDVNEDGSMTFDWCESYILQQNQGEYRVHIGTHQTQKTNGIGFIYQDYKISDEEYENNYLGYIFPSQQIISFNKLGVSPSPYVLNYKKQIDYIYDNNIAIMIQYEDLLEQYSLSDIITHTFILLTQQKVHLQNIVKEIETENTIVSYNKQGVVKYYSYFSDTGSVSNLDKNCDIYKCDYQLGSCPSYCGDGVCCQSDSFDINCDGTIGCSGFPCCKQKNFQGVHFNIENYQKVFRSHISNIIDIIQDQFGNTFIYNQDTLGFFKDILKQEVFRCLEWEKNKVSRLDFKQNNFYLGYEDGFLDIYNIRFQNLLYGINQPDYQEKISYQNLNYNPQKVQFIYFRYVNKRIIVVQTNQFLIFNRNYPYQYLSTHKLNLEIREEREQIIKTQFFGDDQIMVLSTKQILLYEISTNSILLQMNHGQTIKDFQFDFDNQNIFFIDNDNILKQQNLITGLSENNAQYKVCKEPPTDFLSAYQLNNLSPSPSYFPGKISQNAFTIDGVQTHSINTDSSQKFGHPDFSITFWVKIPSSSIPPVKIFDFDFGGNSSRLFFTYQAIGTIQVAFVINFGLIQNNFANFVILDQWMHIALVHTYDAQREVQIYRNGELKIDYIPYGMPPLRNESNNFYLGKTLSKNLGDMDVLKIYSRALSVKEIQCLADQQLFFQDIQTQKKEKEYYPQGTPNQFFKENQIQIPNVNTFLHGKIASQYYLWVCKYNEGSLHQFSGTIIDPLVNTKYVFNGSNCQNILLFNDGSSQKLLSFHEDQSIIVWNFNDLVYSDNNVIHPIGLVYDLFLLDKSLFILSKNQLNNKEYYIQEWDIFTKMQKNLIVNQQKITAYEIERDSLKYAIISFENGRIFKLYPKSNQEYSQYPAEYIHSNTNKVIIIEEYSQYYFILTSSNQLKKVNLDTTFSTFTLHTVGGNSVSYVVNEKFKQIVFYNEESVILYNIDNNVIELLVSGIKQVKTQEEFVIIITEQKVKLYSLILQSYSFSINYGAGKVINDFILKTELGYYFITFNGSAGGQIYDYQNNVVVKDLNLFNFQALKSINNMIYYIANNNMKLIEFQNGEIIYQQIIHGLIESDPLVDYIEFDGRYIVLKNQNTIFFYQIYQIQQVVFQNKVDITDIIVKFLNLYPENQKCIAYNQLGSVYLVDYSKIYNIQIKIFGPPNMEFNTLVQYDSNFNFLIQITNNYIYIWNCDSQRLMNKINLKMYFNSEQILSPHLNKYNNLIMTYSSSKVIFFSYFDQFSQENKIKNLNQYIEKQILIDSLQNILLQDNYVYNEDRWNHRVYKSYIINDQYILSWSYIRMMLFDMNFNLLYKTSTQQINYFLFNPSENLGFQTYNNILKEVKINLVSEEIELINKKTYPELIQKIVQIQDQKCLLIMTWSDGRLYIFNYDTDTNTEITENFPLYQDVYYEENMLNKFLVVTTVPEVIYYQINAGVVDLVALKRISLSNKIDKLYLDDTHSYLYVVLKEAQYLKIYDFSADILAKEIYTPYNEDINIKVQIDKQRLLVYSPFQVNIYEHLPPFKLLNIVRNKDFFSIQELTILDNENYLAMRTNNYIFVIKLEDSYSFYSYSILVKLYYPDLVPTIYNVLYINDDRIEIELLGLYNESVIVNFKQEILTDKKKYLYSYYYDYENQEQYHQIEQVKKFLANNLYENEFQDINLVYQQVDNSIQIPISINDKSYQIFNPSISENNNNYYKSQKQKIDQNSLSFNLNSISGNLIDIFPDYQKIVEFKNLEISYNISDTEIKLQDRYHVSFQNLTFRNIHLNDSNVFFVKDSNLVTLKEIFLRNTQFYNSSFYRFENIDQVIIEDLNIVDNYFYDLQEGFQELFQFKNVKKININNLKIYRNQKPDKCMFDIFNYIGCEQIFINQVNFTQNKNVSMMKQINIFQEEDLIYKLNSDEIQISNSVFENNVLYNSSVIQVQTNDIMVQNSIFNTTVCDLCHGSVLNVEESKFFINSTEFYGNTGFLGGCIYLKNCNVSENLIQNTTFQDNLGFIGGVIHSLNSRIQAINTKVIQNKAHFGSFMFYNEQIPSFFNNSNSLRRNLNTNLQISDISDSQLFFENNNGTMSQSEIETLPSKFSIQKKQENSFWFDTYDSGQILQLEIVFYNNFNVQMNLSTENLSEYQILELQKLFNIRIFINNLKPQKCEILSVSSILLFSFDIQQSNTIEYSLKILGIPGKKSKIEFLVENLYQVDYNLEKIEKINQSQQYDVDFILCVQGQYISQIDMFYKCKYCGEGSYLQRIPSLDEYKANKCHSCPQNAYTCFRDTIIADNGYWIDQQQNLQNQTIVKCYQENHCIQADNYKQNKGNNIVNLQNIEICNYGYLGPLCSECDYYGEKWPGKYFKDSIYQQCISCQDQYSKSQMIKLILKLVIQTMYILFCVNCAIKMQINQTYGTYFRRIHLVPIVKSCFADITTFHIKQFFHYMALQKIATSGIPLQTHEIFSFFTTIFSSPISIFYNIFDCYFNKFEQEGLTNIFYLRTLYSSLIPVIYYVVILFWLLLLMGLKKIERNIKFLFTIGVFLLMYLFPGLVNILIKSMVCREIGNTKYIAQSLRNICLTDDHYYFIKIFALPILSLWSIIIPLTLFFLVKRMVDQKKHNWFTRRIKYGFLIGEFKLKYYFWGFVKIYKNLAIAGLMPLTAENLTTKMVILYLILFTYLTFIHLYKPYKMMYFNQKDYISMVILQVLISLNIIYHHYEYENVRSYTFFLINLINQIYFYHLFFMIIYYRVNKALSKVLIKFSDSCQKHFPFMQKLVSYHKPIQFKTLMRWIFVRKSLKRIMKMEKVSKIEKLKQKTMYQDDFSNIFTTSEQFNLDSPLFSSYKNRKSKQNSKSQKILDFFTPQKQKGIQNLQKYAIKNRQISIVKKGSQRFLRGSNSLMKKESQLNSEQSTVFNFKPETPTKFSFIGDSIQNQKLESESISFLNDSISQSFFDMSSPMNTSNFISRPILPTLGKKEQKAKRSRKNLISMVLQEPKDKIQLDS